jgi:hypothetical protein
MWKVFLEAKAERCAMTSWARLTELDGSHVRVNMENVLHIKRGKEEQTTIVFFVSGAGNEMYVIV